MSQFVWNQGVNPTGEGIGFDLNLTYFSDSMTTSWNSWGSGRQW